MSRTVCLSPKRTLDYVEGGGHCWVYLNWALGLQACGCRVIWLEVVKSTWSEPERRRRIDRLRQHLAAVGLQDGLALYMDNDAPLPPDVAGGVQDLAAAQEADLLLNFRYDLPAAVAERFPRRALVDIDPGLLQLWLHEGLLSLAPHDRYFTIGETVGRPEACFPDGGLPWHYTPPCVALDAWPVSPTPPGAPWTTVAHWFAGSWTGTARHLDDKRTGFQPYLNLPRDVTRPMELALDLPEDHWEAEAIRGHGWRVVNAHQHANGPVGYRDYLQRSYGEFSCAKPSCARLQNAWVSDRTLCYLASGKPAVVEDTGPSRFLPSREGLLRFASPAAARACLKTVETDYEHQCRAARALAEEHFAAARVARRLLEVALP